VAATATAAATTPTVLFTATPAPTVIGTKSGVSSTLPPATTASVPIIISSSAIASDTIPVLDNVQIIPFNSNELVYSTSVTVPITIKFYVSDLDLVQLAKILDANIQKADYQVVNGLSEKISEADKESIGLYVKTDGFGLVARLLTGNLEDYFQDNKILGITITNNKKFLDQLKGKKTLVFLVASPDLLENLNDLPINGNVRAVAELVPIAITPTMAPTNQLTIK
jgi:hypothetical protein